MSENHWIAQLLFGCETDAFGHPSEQEFHKAAAEVQAMASEAARLRGGLKRLDSWDILTDEDRHAMIAEILDGSWPPTEDHVPKGDSQ